MKEVNSCVHATTRLSGKQVRPVMVHRDHNDQLGPGKVNFVKPLDLQVFFCVLFHGFPAFDLVVSTSFSIFSWIFHILVHIFVETQLVPSPGSTINAAPAEAHALIED